MRCITNETLVYEAVFSIGASIVMNIVYERFWANTAPCVYSGTERKIHGWYQTGKCNLPQVKSFSIGLCYLQPVFMFLLFIITFPSAGMPDL